VNPHFYRLRKDRREGLGARKCDGEMRKGLLQASPPRQQKQCNSGTDPYDWTKHVSVEGTTKIGFKL